MSINCAILRHDGDPFGGLLFICGEDELSPLLLPTELTMPEEFYELLTALNPLYTCDLSELADQAVASNVDPISDESEIICAYVRFS